ncbi:hypothetical protein [Bradyrhizobium sp. LHD-71]|uniref:hypothetical protein n=1 Tax=Bradyrhizobium sp. LHD-71 TaxID=3072141 RepID=UPI00280CDF0E|nr:hypothetical protein [Bradyrhizobium sp. LHD-71]MDQ8729395.1 hypothetical protein [Bradyrhizobium sp. LHD-71]
MKIVPIIALAVLVATPALAASTKKKMPRQAQGYYQQERDWRGSRNMYRGDGYLRGPNVYSPSGRFVGRDPSPNVRQRMYDDDLRLRNQF